MHPDIQDIDSLITHLGSTTKCVQKLLATIASLSSTRPTTILISGEPGTEKGLMAQHIHKCLQKNTAQLMSINCFSMTGKTLKQKMTSHSGMTTTFLLNKINNLSPSLQSQLFSLLKDLKGYYQSKNNIVHIVATLDDNTGQPHKNNGLEKKLDDFFGDCRISLPSLKERKHDIPLLLDTLSRYYSEIRKQQPIHFSENAKLFLTQYPWQRNTRELKSLVKHLVLQHSGKRIGKKELPIHFQNQTAHQQPWSDHHAELNWDNEPVDLKHLIDQYETELIVTAMRKSGGNKMEAARLLNLKRTTLIEKIKKKGIKHLW